MGGKMGTTNTSRLEIVKVSPLSSSGNNFLFLALSLISISSEESSNIDFLSTSFITGTIKPADEVSTATPKW